MSSRNAFAAPRTIRRIAARRVFQSASGRPVVLTIGVPQAVPGSDWGCALQITGLKTAWRRPRYVFGVDGIQALHLAMTHAGVILESTKPILERCRARWKEEDIAAALMLLRSLDLQAMTCTTVEVPPGRPEAAADTGSE